MIKTLGIAFGALGVTAFLPFIGSTIQDGVQQKSDEAVILDLQAERKVSLRFQDATAQEVFARLREMGVDFVFDRSALPAEARLSLVLTDVPESSAVQAIAEALGYTAWQRDGIWRIRKGNPVLSPEFFMGEEGMPKIAMPDFDMLDMEIPAEIVDRLHEFEWRQFRGAPHVDFKNMPELKKWIEERGGTFEWDGEGEFDFEFDGDAFSEMMRDRMLDVERLVEQAMKKALEDEELTDAERAEIKEEIAKLRERMPAIRERIRWIPMPDVDGRRIEAEVRKAMGERAGKFVIRDGKALVESITPGQWQLHEQQGHLKIADLSREQRELIGNPKVEGESFKVQISVDGKTLKIEG